MGLGFSIIPAAWPREDKNFAIALGPFGAREQHCYLRLFVSFATHGRVYLPRSFLSMPSGRA
jgi:hypothetical protein